MGKGKDGTYPMFSIEGEAIRWKSPKRIMNIGKSRGEKSSLFVLYKPSGNERSRNGIKLKDLKITSDFVEAGATPKQISCCLRARTEPEQNPNNLSERR